MESVLDAIEQADYADETGIYRDWLAELDDPTKSRSTKRPTRSWIFTPSTHHRWVSPTPA